MGIPLGSAFFTLWSAGCFFYNILVNTGPGKVLTHVMPWELDLPWLSCGIPLSLTPFVLLVIRRLKGRRKTEQMWEYLPASVQQEITQAAHTHGLRVTPEVVHAAFDENAQQAKQAHEMNDLLEKTVPVCSTSSTPSRL